MIFKCMVNCHWYSVEDNSDEAVLTHQRSKPQ